MSLRQREYTLEVLEQRMLLSGDGFAPLVPPAENLPSWTPVDVVIVSDTVAEEQTQTPADAGALVDTSPVVTETVTVAENDVSVTQTTVENTVTLTTSVTPATPSAVTPPADPLVSTAADFSVMTLTSGNGPPSAGDNDSANVSDDYAGEELSPWDPPFGGFEFTATHANGTTQAEQYADLNELFSTGLFADNGGVVEMYGTMVKRPDVGTTDYALGLLSLEGTFYFARHVDGVTPAVDGAGHYVFDVWFDTTLTNASWTVGDVTLNLTVTEGAFLVSGKLTNPAALNPAEYDLGGVAGTLTVEAINGLLGSGDDVFTFGALTGGTLTFNTASAVANLATPGMTSGTNIGGTGLNATFASASNFLSLGGNVSIALGGAVGVTFNGAVVFEVADTNGATAGGQVLTVELTAATAAMAVTGVTVTASGVNATFQISSAGVVGATTIAGLSISGGGTSTTAFTNGTFNIDTTGPTVALTIGATVNLSINQGGIQASLSGTFTFDRGMLGGEEIIRIGVTDASSSFSAGGTSLTISDIDGAFVIKSNGFAGKATVGDIELVGIPGLTFNLDSLLFEINTTDAEINNLVIPGTATTLNFTGNDRKKFFRLQGGVELGISLGGIEANLDGTFYFEQFTLPGPTNVVKFAAIGANASFSAGSVSIGVSNVNGGFILKDGGIAGYVTATSIDVDGLPAGVTVGGSGLSFAINTTGAAAAADFGSGVAFDYSDADELNFVSVGGTITLGLEAGGAAVSVTGSTAFYRGDVDGTEVVKIGLDDLTASITVGGVTATITHIEGIVLVTDAGVAGRIGFDSMTIEGINDFTFAADDFTFEFNTTGLEIDEELTIGDVTQTLQYTAADNETDFFRGSGDLVIAFNGGGFAMSIEGTFAFEAYDAGGDLGTVVKFGFENVSFDIAVGGDGLKLVVEDADGFFLFQGDNYAGRLSISDAHLEGVTGLQIAVTDFNFEVNTFGEAVETSIVIGEDDAVNPGDPDADFVLDFSEASKHDFIALGGTLDLVVDMGGFNFTLAGRFYFERTTVTLNEGTPGETDVDTFRIAVSEASFSLTIGTVALAASKINGGALIQADGTVAMQLSIGRLELTGITGFTFLVEDFFFKFNDTGGSINEDFDFGDDGDAETLDLIQLDFAEDIIALGGTVHLGLDFGGFSTTLNGTFLFEQTASKVKIGIKDADFNLTIGSVALNITEVNGLFALYDDGSIAMQLRIGEVALTGITGFTFTVEDFFLKLNDTGGVVSEEFDFDGDAGTTDDILTIDFTEDIIALGGTVHLGLDFGGFSTTLNGTFLFEQTASKVKIGIKDADFNLTIGSVALNITEVNGLFALYDDGTIAMQLRIGEVALTGITGFTFTVEDFFLKLNDTGGVVSEEFDFDGDAGTTDDIMMIDFTEDIIALGGTVHLGLDFGGFSTTLNGTFLFEQTASKVKIGIKDADFNLTIGSVALNITEVNGLFALYDDGSIAMQLRIGEVALTGITGFTFTVEDFFLKLNDTGGVVSEEFDFDGDAGTTDDIMTIDFAEDIIALGGTVHLGLDFGGFSTTLNGTFLFEQTASKVKIGIKDADFNLTIGAVALNITEVNGLFALYDDGSIAMQLAVGSVELSGITGLTFIVTDFYLGLNDTGGPVNEEFDFDGDAGTTDDILTIDFDDDILSLGGTVELGIVAGGVTSTIKGGMFFEQTNDLVTVSVSDASLLLSVGASIEITGVNGAFAIMESGSAGKLSVDSIVLGGVPAFGIEVEDFYIEFNNTGEDVEVEVPVVGGGDPVELSFTGENRHDFVLISGSITVKIGGTPASPFVTLTAQDVVVDTGATGSEHVFEAGLLSGSITIGSLGTITVTAGNLAVTAEGKLTNLDPDSLFFVSVTFGGAGDPAAPNADAFQWPTWLPIQIKKIALYWEDVENAPTDFILVLSASIGPFPGLTTLNFSGMVENLRLDVGKLTDGSGDFPILGFDAAAVQISGNLFGMAVSGGIVMGMIDFRADGTIIDRNEFPTEVADGTIFYFGLNASVNIAGVGGAGFRIGMADIDPTAGVEIVPLQAYISVAAPVIIEPISGLTLGAFTAGIEFASTLEDEHYEDIDNLKLVTIANSLNPSLDVWENGLRTSTLAIYNGSESGDGDSSVWDQPMVITAAVTLYSSYISPQALNGTLMVKLDTEGRILLIGELLFGGGNLKLDAKMYADLSDTAGGVKFTFYGSLAPTAIGGPKPFEVWGELDIRILDANGIQLTGDPEAGEEIGGAAILQIEFEGGVQFTGAGVVTARAEGTVKLEVDFSDPGTTVITLGFNATLSLINPPGNPLGDNFADVAGTVVIRTIDDGGVLKLELYGALSLSFNGAVLAQYGIEVNNADIFVQINTTADEKFVTLEFFDETTEDVTLRPEFFSIYIKGDIGIGTPADPATHLLDLKGFIILEVDANGLTVVVDADIVIAPNGQQMLKFEVTGFMRVNADGIAARLDLGLVTDFPPETQLELEGSFTLLLNTTEQEVTYTIPDWFYENGETPETIIIPEAAPALGGDLTQPDATGPPGGEAYFLIYVDGSLSAMGGTFTLDGEFFILITETEFQLAVDATLEIGPAGSPFITFTAEGFMKITAGGIAARLDLGVALDMPDELSFSAGFTLVLNTTGEIVTYSIKDENGDPQLITIAQAAPEIGGDLEEAAGGVSAPGETYFLLYMHGSLTALSLTLEGDFFIVITEDMVQLQVNAALEIASLELEVHGFLEIGSEGAAGLLEISSSLDLPGITITDATFLIAFNTFSYDYELPDPVATQFDLPLGSKLDLGLIRIEISGAVDIGGVFELQGRFFFEHTPEHDILEVNATMSMPVIGSLLIDGALIITDDGVVGSLTATIQSAQGLADIGITFSATLLLKVNTTDVDANDPGVVDDPALDPEDQVMIEADTVLLVMDGDVTLLGQFTFDGYFYFKKSGSDLQIVFDATLNLSEIGTFTVTGDFSSTAAGFKAVLTLQLQTSASLAAMGFQLHGDFLLAINSSNTAMTLSGLTGELAAFNGETLGVDTLKIYVKGGITLFDALELSGTFELTKGVDAQGNTYIEVAVTAKFDLLGLVEIDVNGFAGIYSDGIVLAVDVAAEFGFPPIFEATGTLQLRLNTTDQDRVAGSFGLISDNYFRINVPNLSLKLLGGIFTMSGSLYFEYEDGDFILRVTASMQFFGLGSVSITGFFTSFGTYELWFNGSIGIGVDGFFGIFGSLSFHIKGNSDGPILVEGSIGGTAYLVGIGFGVNVGISWDGGPTGSGRLRASVSVTIDFWLFSITYRGNFDLGYIKSKQTYQAGTAGNNRIVPADEEPFASAGGGQLIVNVGSLTLRNARNYSETDVDEQVMIRQIGAEVDGKATIEVEVFGLKKRYTDVSSVHMDLLDGDDFVYVRSSVTIPVTIELGEGNDVVEVESGGSNNDITIWGEGGNDTITGGSGAETIYGGEGDDYIRSRGGNDYVEGGGGRDVIEGGSGADTLFGQDGDDSFVWFSGDDQDAVISGGDGINSLNIVGDSTANNLGVTANGSNFTALIDGSSLNPTAVSVLFAAMNDGADVVTLGLLDTTILTSISIGLGYNDGDADQITITGSGAADYYHLTSTSTTENKPISTSYDDPENPVTTYQSVTTNQVRITKTEGADLGSGTVLDYYLDEGGYAQDRVIMNAGDGNDEIDALNVEHQAVKFTLNGGNGNDTLVGSDFADTINGDAGNDTVTGGPGVDIFTDTTGADILIEQMDRNFTLNGWTLVSGSESENLANAAFETIRLTGGATANTFTISNLLATTLWLDGSEHNDVYIINVRGSGISTLNVFDSGVGVPNTETLTVNGTAGDDLFLIRDGLITVGVSGSAHFETINYGGVNEFSLHGGEGRDSFTVDEIRGAGAIYGDGGDDTFTVGRILAPEGEAAPAGISTIDTTRGWLSYGNFAVFEIYGGEGNDTFEINHNQAELRLFGEAGDDLFWVKTYLEEGSALSTVNGGGGDNIIRYVQNGPLKIDGGTGFDRIILEGTEADDVFIITDAQIFGGGRQIDFVNVEGIVILGVGGNDTFWILGNGLPLEIQGGTGNDTVYIGGQAPDYLYDAPEYIVDPPAYIDHYVPVFTTPPPIVINVAAHWAPVRWAGITWWWNWVNAFQIVIPRAPVLTGWDPVWVDPPAYTVDPNPITYRFKEVTQFDGVVAGVEVYEWATANSGPGGTPTSTKDLGTIDAPIKFVGGNDPGILTENDRLVANLGTATGNLLATLQTVDEVITEFNLDTKTESFVNKGPIGQLLGLGFPDSLVKDGRTFMGGLTFLGVESAEFTFGSGNDTFNLDGTFDEMDVTVNSNGGTDVFNVKANSGNLVLNGGAGNDTFNLDSNAPAAGNGTVDGITGAVTINGGADTDIFYLDDRLDTAANTMLLTSTAITGLGMTGGVNYSFLESLTFMLGSGADTVNLRSLAVPVSLNTGGGNDTIHVGSNAGAGNTNGTLATIASTLTLNGGTGGASVIFDDTGDGAANTGTLTSTTLTGLGLGGVVTYSNLSILTINLGGGGDTFTIETTHAAVTNLSTGGGNDSVAIRVAVGPTNVNTGAGDDTVRVGSLAPSAGGTLNGISGLLGLDGGTGVNQLHLDDTADGVANTGTLTASTLTGLGMAQGINYLNFATLDLGLGSGDDIFAIVSTHAGTTSIDFGAGDDSVTVNSTHLFGANPLGAVLNLDGNEGSDFYTLWFSGAGASLVNVLDTGAAGTNGLELNGTPLADVFLLRSGFVAVLQYVNGVQQPTFERVNYDGQINGGLTINPLGGANYFAIDNNSTTTVINGGNDGDTYQIGQVYGDNPVREGLAPTDMVETTHGWLSLGVVHTLAINGGTGDDIFTVFHNRATLDLDGGDGNDVFTIRSFALKGSAEGAEAYDPDRGATNIATGAGANHVAYALNAPISINGGGGFNTVVIIATEFSDSIIITQDGVYGTGQFVTFTNIQELIVQAAEGNDNIWILGTPAGTHVRIVGGLGSDTFHLGGAPDPIEVANTNPDGTPAPGTHWVTFAPVYTLTDIDGPLTLDGSVGDGVPPLTAGIGLPGESASSLNFINNPNLGVNEAHMIDRVIVRNEDDTSAGVGVLTGNRLTGLGLTGATVIATVAFDAGVGYTELEEVVVNLGSGNDTFTIETTLTGRTIISGADGNDTINVRSVSGHTTVYGGNGEDVINVGSLAPATGGDLDGIDALLALDGGAGLDTLNIDQRGNTLGSTGWLTQTTLTGLEMTSDLAVVNDSISLKVSGDFTLSYAGQPDELLGLGSTADDITAALWRLLGNRNAFAQQLGDEFIINFQGEVRGQVVALGVTGAATVAHRIHGINYQDVDVLNLDLGSAADVLNVRGTTAVTNVNSHDGEDRFYVSSSADLTTSTFTDLLAGHLDDITGTLNINAGTGRNLLMVSDGASSVANGAPGTPALVTHSLIRGFAPADINYLADPIAGSFAQGITLWTGAGADLISVTSTDHRADVRTTTTVNSGAGNDHVTVALSVASDGFFVLNTQDGDDTVDASVSTLPVIVFGGSGADTLTGGTSGDILFGDHGRVQYLDGVTVVAQIGGGGPGDFTDGLFHDDYIVFTTDTVLGAGDTINGLTGGDVILGGAAGDTLNGGEGGNIVLGDHGTVTVVTGIVTSATTAVAASGGADTITTLSGRDFILGGEAGDLIDAGAGDDAIAGDHGTFVIVSPTAFIFTAAEFANGGADTLTGGAGADLIVGGADNDLLLGNDGANVVLGDHGTVAWESATGSVTVTSSAESTGGDDTIVTGIDADVILGGAAADDITSGAGNDLVFGDAGTVTLSGGLPVSAATTAPGSGTGDLIQTNDGADTVLGGDGDDTIDGGNGANLVLGDYGVVNWNGALHTLATATSQGSGGSDTITTGLDNDLILGGNAGDVVHAGAGDDVVVGDQGVITFDDGVVVLVTNSPAVGDGNDQLFGEDGNDSLLGGGADDTIEAGAGANVVLGDHGELSFTAGTLVEVLSTNLGGGNDTLGAGADHNIVIGGLGSDTITTLGGTNVIFGDEGLVVVNGTLLISATTLHAGTGANDAITVGDGSHWIFGGDAADTITAGNGFAAVFGDHGQIELGAGDSLALLSLEFGIGGADLITTGAGADFILGGTDADTINAGEGDNVVLGDHGEILATAGQPDFVRTIEPTAGAGDTIRTGAGNDIILGGAGADDINAGDGRNVVLGDHGELEFTAGSLVLVSSVDYEEGGNDLISAGSGQDVLIGGFASDTINGGAGDDLILGDQGTVEVSGGVLVYAQTDEPTVGSADAISGGAGSDFIIGGLGGDSIDAGEGNNFVLGDHGELHWLLGVLARMLSIDFSDGAEDVILSGSGNDVILAGPANDTINAGAGSNVVLGDNGDVLLSGELPVFVQTLEPESSANDNISTGAGRDLILGGQGTDVISAGEGDDVVLGDEGSFTLAGGVIVEAASERFADGSADTIFGEGGNDAIAGGNAADLISGGTGDDVVAGDNAIFTFVGGVLVRMEALAPVIGTADEINGDEGDDAVMAGAGDDLLFGGEDDDVLIGDHATLTFEGGLLATLTPSTPEIGGDDTIMGGAGHDLVAGGTGADWIDAGEGHDVVFGDHAHLVWTGGALTLAESVDFAEGGADLIFAGAGNDFISGGTAGDTIHAGEGNDLVFGDHAMISGAIDLALLPLAMADKPFVFAAIATQNLGADGRPQGGDDVVFAGAGDDIVFGQQGDDILFGEDGNDDLVGGHNVSLGQDGADVLEGGAGFDVLAGDNAAILRTGDNLSLRARVLAGIALFDDRGNLLTLDNPQAWPTDVPERATILLDHAFDTAAGLFGADQLVGGAGDDVLFGQLGNDSLHGDAALAVDIGAEGTIDRAAVRAAATALFAGAFWAGADTDGDDYIEGNGGDDLIFGGLGQDDLLGGNSSMFGLTDRTLRPDGADTIYGGNGSAAGFEDMGDGSLNGRARDADVILGDNADIVRLVGLNGVSVGAFLTFSYDQAGTQKIIVRGFALLDYTVPESPDDIGAADAIFGEAGDDTLHGQVGADELQGNGNDDNLYGGQGDDLIFGGGGDDAISPSDELKPPAPPSSGAADAGSGDASAGSDDVIQTLPSNVPVLLFVPGSGPAEGIYLAQLFLGFSNDAPLGNSDDAVFADGGNAWRIFSSGVFPSTRFGEPAMTFDMQMGLGDFEPAGAEGEPTPEQPAEEEQPEAAPTEGETPPAEEEAAPAGDEAPAAPPAEDEEPAAPEENELPPAPPAPEGGLPPAPPNGA